MKEQNIKSLEFEQVLRREQIAKSICAELNAFSELKDALRIILTWIKDLSQCESVGIRLHNKGDYPYYVHSGFSESFILHENSLCSKDKNGTSILETDANTDKYQLDCMCGNIIRGRYNPKLPFFTTQGSFWSNNTTLLLAQTTPVERISNTRNYCNSSGYESVALIPIKAGNDNIGLIQLNDKRLNMFSLDFIEFMEMIGKQIGLAVQNSLRYSELKEQKDLLQNTLQKLQITMDDLLESRKMAALGELLSGFAHKIGTPLGSSQMGMSLLLKELQHLKTVSPEVIEKSFSHIYEIIEIVKQNMGRISKLSYLLKSLAAAENAGKPETLAINNFLHDFFNNHKDMLEKHKITVDINCSQNLLFTCNASALFIVLSNLLNNSVRHAFSEQGGKITLTATTDNNNLILSYADNGKGISAPNAKNIFNPFFTTEPQYGSGLGLTIAKNVAYKQLHGSLDYFEPPNGGVNFTLRCSTTK